MKYAVLFIFGLLVACGSEPTQPKSDTAADGSAELDQATTPTKKKTAEIDTSEKVAKHETPSALYLNLSEAYKSQNEDNIQNAAMQILAQNPNDLRALNAIGLCYYRKGKFQAARYFLGRAEIAAPRSGEVMNNLGLVALADTEPHEAVRYFRKAIEFAPNDPVASANLGSFYVQQKDYAKAEAVLGPAAKSSNRDSKVLNNYGIVLAATGKPDQAKKIYEEALKTNSNSQELLFNYASVLIDQLKLPNEGLDQLNRLNFLGPGPELRNKMNALENRAKAGIK